ncbi:MAG: hypothetical protein ACJZ9F_11275 [Rhodospirillaceae bacterium]
MTTALVSSTSIAQATVRVAQARVGDSTSFSFVDPLENTLGSQPGDHAIRYDERWEDLNRRDRRPRQGWRDQPFHFGGIYVSREVGATIMQAQEQGSLPQGRLSASEAQKHIRIYEFNQALVGTPEAITTVGISR